MENFKPQAFGKFFLLNKIAQGGMAEIFVAIDSGKKDDSLLVIKKLLHKYSEDKKFVSMLIDEAKITSLLEHPQIVKVYDVGSVGRDFYISLEYINGKSLDHSIARAKAKNKLLPLPTVSYIAYKTCQALHYAHRFKDSEGRPLNLVHRDVTPGNLLLSYTGDVKLADFGIATVGRASIFQRDEVAFGKKFYMPPEQLKNLALDRRTDVYSLGALVYEMICGHKIFQASNEIELQDKIINYQPKSLSSYDHRFEKIDKIIFKALSKNPTHRYSKAKEFGNAISEALPFDADEESKNLSSFLNDLFHEDMQKEEKLLKESLASFTEHREEFPLSPKDDSSEDPRISSEKTQFIMNDYKDTKTGFKPKETTDEPGETQGKIETEDSKVARVKIKTKKIAPEELQKIKIFEADKQVAQKEWEPDITLLKLRKAEAQKEPDEDDQSFVKIVKDSKPPSLPEKEPRQKTTEDRLPGESEHKRQRLPENEEIKLEKVSPTPEEPTADIKEKRQKKELPPSRIKGVHRPLLYTGLLILLILSSVAVFRHILNIQTKAESFPKMNPANPQKISLIIFSNKPDRNEKKIFQKILQTRKDDTYENLGSLKEFFANEYRRYKNRKMEFLEMSVVGPLVVEKSPPPKTKLFTRKNIFDYFLEKSNDYGIPPADPNTNIYIFFYSKKPEEVPRYPIIYRDFLVPKSQIVFLPLLKEEINSSIILLANRILAVFGASEKTTDSGRPKYPDGLAEPNSNPLYPQRYAEIMARYIPESRDSVRVAKSLRDVRIGPKTALEIGWINETEYKKFVSK